jgi:hypothetical protein
MKQSVLLTPLHTAAPASTASSSRLADSTGSTAPAVRLLHTQTSPHTTSTTTTTASVSTASSATASTASVATTTSISTTATPLRCAARSSSRLLPRGQSSLYFTAVNLHLIVVVIATLLLELQLALLASETGVFALERFNISIDAAFERAVTRLLAVHHSSLVKVHHLVTIIRILVIEHQLAVQVCLCLLPCLGCSTLRCGFC